jgi:hypothetical protein
LKEAKMGGSALVVTLTLHERGGHPGFPYQSEGNGI